MVAFDVNTESYRAIRHARRSLLMARVEGFYWAAQSVDMPPVIAHYEDGMWDFGDGDEPCSDDEVVVLSSSPLTPPDAERAAGWKGRYAKMIATLKKARKTDPLGGWDYLDGYYFIRTKTDAAPVLAQYLEGWGYAVREEELADAAVVEILDGPLARPRVTRRQTA
jgi:hypothetical protein